MSCLRFPSSNKSLIISQDKSNAARLCPLPYQLFMTDDFSTCACISSVDVGAVWNTHRNRIFTCLTTQLFRARRYPSRRHPFETSLTLFFFPSLEYPRTHTARWMDTAGGGEGWTIIYMNFHTPHISIVNIIPRLKLSGQLPSMNCCRDLKKLISELFEEVRRREWRISKKRRKERGFQCDYTR